MAGTREGGLKGKEKLLAKDPDYFKKIGAIGGKNGRGYKFGHGKVDPRIIGAKGGRISRRTKKNA